MNDQIEDQAQQIVPQLRWVSEAGGPEIRRIDNEKFGKIKLAGLNFKWYLYADQGQNQDLTSNDFGDEKDWISVNSWSLGKVEWKRNRTLETRKGEGSETKCEYLFLSARGECSTVCEAVERARDWIFERQGQAGFTWFKTGPEKWDSQNWDDELEVESIDMKDSLKWIWKRKSKKLEPLTMVVGGGRLSGWSETLEQAMHDAAQAVDKLLDQCLLVTGDNNQFERGKAAGRAELAAEFNQLVCGSKK